MGEVILEMKGIDKSFPGVHALDHVDLEIRKGEVLALMVENGAGKSTLMKVLTGIYTKDSGTITYEGKALTEGQDYTLSYEKNTDAGMANVVIQGKGIYTGEAYKTFEITRADASVSVSSKTVTMGKKKMALADWMTTDGKVTYKSSDSKTVKISGNQFIALKPGKAVITISAKQGQNYNALPATKVTITVRPLNTTGVALKSARKGQAKVSWKPVKSISGYQIQYSSSANMKKAKFVNAKSSAKNITVKKLSSKKKCYIRIRTYKTIKGKKYYSDWSKVKKVKVR